MPQFLLSVCHPGEYPNRSEAEMTASFAEVGAFNARLEEAGELVFAGGLDEASTSVVVDGTEGSVVTTSGPFLTGPAQIGGFWVVDVPDRKTALALAAEGSRACGQAVEVRAFQGE